MPDTDYSALDAILEEDTTQTAARADKRFAALDALLEGRIEPPTAPATTTRPEAGQALPTRPQSKWPVVGGDVRLIEPPLGFVPPEISYEYEETPGLTEDQFDTEGGLERDEARLYPRPNPAMEHELAEMARANPETAKRIAQRLFPLPDKKQDLTAKEYRAMGRMGVAENTRRGMATWQYKIPFTGGLLEAGDVMNLMLRKKRLQENQYDRKMGKWLGNALREQDIRVLKNWIETSKEEVARGLTKTAWAAGILANMPTFMIEFAGTMGMGPGVRKAGAAAAKAIARRQLREIAKLLAKWGVKASKRAAVNVVTTQASRVVAGVATRSMDQRFYIDENRHYHTLQPGQSMPAAILNSALDIFVENFTEQTGELAMMPVKALVGKIAGAVLRKGRKLTPKAQFARALVEGIQRAWDATGKPRSALAKAFQRGGFDGVLEEFSEERIGEIMKAAMSEVPGVEIGSWEQAKPNLEQYAVELLAFGTVGGLGAAANTGADLLQARREAGEAGQAGIEAAAEAAEPEPTPRQGPREAQPTEPEEDEQRPLDEGELDQVRDLLKAHRTDAEGRPVIRAGLEQIPVTGLTAEGLQVVARGANQTIPPAVLRQRLAQEAEGEEGDVPLLRTAASFVVDTVRDPDRKAKGRWAVVERADLEAKRREGEEAGLQARDRSRKASREQAAERKGKFQPRYLGESEVADRGSVIVNRTGQILAGYGRLQTLGEVYDEDAQQARSYRQWVAEQAEAKGLRHQLRGVQEPVLVRVAEEFVNTNEREFATFSNDRVTLGFSPAEQAMKDARMLRDQSLDQLLDTPESGDLNAASNREFAKAFIHHGRIGAEMLDREGEPLPELSERMERAVLASLFVESPEGADTVGFLLEKNRDSKTKKLAQTLATVAPRLLKLSRSKPMFDVLPHLGRALTEAVRARNAVRTGEAKTEADFFRQGDFLTRASETEREVAALLLEETPDTVREVLRRYAASTESIDTRTGSLFGQEELPDETLLGILRGVWSNVRREQEQPETEATGVPQGEPAGPEPSPPAEADTGAGEGGTAGEEGGAEEELRETRPAFYAPGDTLADAVETPVFGSVEGEADLARLLDQATDGLGRRGTPPPLGLAQVDETLAELIDVAGVAPFPTRLVDTVDEIPDGAFGETGRPTEGQAVESFLGVDGKVYLVRETLRHEAQRHGMALPEYARRKWVHEQAGHGLFWAGIDAEGRAEALDGIALAVGEKALRDALPAFYGREADRRRERYGKRAAQHYLAAEYLARLAERADAGETLSKAEMGFWRRILDAIRRLLRKLGFTTKAWTNPEIDDLAKALVRGLAKGVETDYNGLTLNGLQRVATSGNEAQHRQSVELPGEVRWSIADDQPELPGFATLGPLGAVPAERGGGAQHAQVGSRLRSEWEVFRRSRELPELFPVAEWDLPESGEVSNPDRVAALCTALQNPTQERLLLVPLDRQQRIAPTGPILLALGGVDYAKVPMEVLYQAMARSGGERFVLVHNHPTGNSLPSQADQALTKQVVQGCAELGMPGVLADHVVIGSDEWFSFLENMTDVFGEPGRHPSLYPPPVRRNRPGKVSLNLTAGFGRWQPQESVLPATTEAGIEKVYAKDVAGRVATVVYDHFQNLHDSVLWLGLDSANNVRAMGLRPFAEDVGPHLHDFLLSPGIRRVLLAFRSETPREWAGKEIGAIQRLKETAKLVDLQLVDAVRVVPGYPAVSVRDEGLFSVADDGSEPGSEAAAWRMPALVELSRLLLDGKLPGVRKSLRTFMGAQPRGVFKHGEGPGAVGEIDVLADLFTGPRLAAIMVPEQKGEEMEQELVKGLIERVPGLTESNLVIQRKRAAKRGWVLLTAYRRDHEYVNRVLAHEIGHAYDWSDDRTLKRGNLLGHVAALNRWLRHMIQNVPPADEESLIDESTRSELENEARRRATKEAGSKSKNEENWKEARARNYAKLRHEWAVSHGVALLDDVQEELVNLTQWWKPFDVDANPEFTAYRHSANELTADAISVLLNAPEELAARAPGWYGLFQSYMTNRPAAAKAYRQTTEALYAGRTIAGARARLHEGFREGHRRWRLQYERDHGIPGGVLGLLRRAFSSRAAAIATAERRKGNERPDRPTRAIEEARYAAAPQERYVRAVHREILPLLARARLPMELFEEYLFHNRILGDRYDLANPEGWRPAASRRTLAVMRQDLGGVRFDVLAAAAERFRAIREEMVIDEMARLDPWSEELLDRIRENDRYVRFDVVKYIDEHYGKGNGLRVFGQTGTLEDIAAPLEATLVQDLRFLWAARWNWAKRRLAEALLGGEIDGTIRPAETRWSGRRLDFVEPNDKGLSLLTYMDRGELRGYYIPAEFATPFERGVSNDVSAAMSLAGRLGNLLRFMLVFVKPGYHAYNLVRDVERTMFNAPGLASPVVMPWYYARAGWELLKEGTTERSDVVDEMLKNGELISMAYRHAATKHDTELRRLLASYGLRDPALERGSNPAVRLAADVWTAVRAIPRFVERLSKTAAHIYLKERYPDLGDAEIAHRVRTQLGSPDFIERGQATWLTNQLWLFSNAMIQGFKTDWEASTGQTAVNRKALQGLAQRSVLWKRLLAYGPAIVVCWAAKRGLLAKWASALFGDDDEWTEAADAYQDAMLSVTEHDATNYLCLPLARYETGQTLYFRVPLEETGRLVHGMAWNLLDAAAGKGGSAYRAVTHGLRYGADQIPSRSPILEVVEGALQALAGRVPVDQWRDRAIMRETTWKAREERPGPAASAYAKWAWSKLGLGIVWAFQPEWKQDQPEAPEDSFGHTVQKLDQAPYLAMLNDMVGRFFKVTDYGRVEAARTELHPLEVRQAADAEIARELTRRVAKGTLGEMTDREAEVYARNRDRILRAALKLAQGKGLSAEERIWFDATDREKAWLQMTPEERKNALE